jgi:hypothetical protein
MTVPRALLLLVVPLALVAVLLLDTGCDRRPAGPPESPEVLAARAFYASQPRYLRPVPFSPVPAGLPDLRASTCGACHVDIYNEWRISTHARAWLDDAQFQEELKKTTAVPGRDASWLCVNCHTPFETQLPRLVTGLVDGDRGLPIYVDNPHFDAKLQLEAITCATCHVKDGVVLGPYGNTNAPHPVKKSDDLLSPDNCLQCHQAEAHLDDVNLSCFFDTGESFAAGPWAAEGKICQDCHMPPVERPVSNISRTVRPGRRHWFGGSLIPKKEEFEPEMAALRQVYPNGARIEWVARPERVAPGDSVTLTFAVTNAEAGHTLPTGDVERYLLVTGRVRDAEGRLLVERTERFGTRYQWEPRAVELEDNRLLPRETRTFTVTFRAPAAGPLALELEGSNHRISPENFDYHELEGRYVASRVFYESTETLTVDGAGRTD